MRRFLKWLRGLFGTAAVWAFGFGAIGTVVTGMSGYGLVATLSAFLPNAICGFVLGGTFAGILSLAERRRSLTELSVPRVGMWGALGTMLLAPGMTTGLVEYVYAVALGAGFAAGSVALAKRVSRREAIHDGEDSVLELGAG